MPPKEPAPMQGVKWNEVTWYSKLGAIILFLGVVPTLCFYIGMQYGALQDTLLTNAVIDSNQDHSRDDSCLTQFSANKDSGKNIPFPFSCFAKIGTSTTVVFDVVQDGSLYANTKGKNILSLTSTTSNIYLISAEPNSFFSGNIALVDINYDGYLDLEINQADSGAYNKQFAFYLFDPSSGIYEPSSAWKEFTNPIINTAARTIKTLDWYDAVGNSYGSDTYHFENNTYVLVSKENKNSGTNPNTLR